MDVIHEAINEDSYSFQQRVPIKEDDEDYDDEEEEEEEASSYEDGNETPLDSASIYMDSKKKTFGSDTKQPKKFLSIKHSGDIQHFNFFDWFSKVIFCNSISGAISVGDPPKKEGERNTRDLLNN